MQNPCKLPLFSVVIPAYQAEPYIIDALESVKRQTFLDYEIIVVDDGSRDATSTLVKAWGNRNKEKVLRLYRQVRKGIGAARNKAIWQAEGSFVAFLDSDDRWLDSKLESVATYLGGEPEVDLICHDEWLMEDGKKLRHIKCGPYTKYKDLLFRGNCLSTSATVVRRSKLLDVGGFSEELWTNEDYDLWLRLARERCRFANLHKVLGVARIHAQGITRKADEHCEHGLKVLEFHYRQWGNESLYYRYMLRRRKAGVIRGAGITFMKQRDFKKAQRFFKLALRQDPLAWKTWLLSIMSLARLRV